jgi:hypothetical protein
MAASLREFFMLARAERVIRAYSPAQYANVGEHFRAAEVRVVAGRRQLDPVPACLLLRDAVAHYLEAAEIARSGIPSEDGTSSLDLASTMPRLAPDPARPAAGPTDDSRVRQALAERSTLYFDRLSLEDVARARCALDRAASMLRGRIEVRSIANIRGTRYGRLAALAVILAYAAFVSVRSVLRAPNVALQKPVIPSSVWYQPTEGQTIVDGETGTTFGVHTRLEESPYVTIDLQDDYRIEKVRVHNRADGWFDDCLPLVLELSLDGRDFAEVARRESHFDADPPWVIDVHGQRARYVRLRVARRTYLALSEVEVFGRRK